MEKMTIPFKVEHIDPLGQGVSKLNNQVTFIAKVLPDEEGEAELYKKSKGVSFAKLTKLNKPSALRIQPECPHFEQCHGCHFLQTNYDNELVFKKNGLTKQLQKVMTNQTIQMVAAENRLGYRNRIQLHYNLKLQKLGFINPISQQIIEVPHCLIAHSQVKAKLDELYQEKMWIRLIPKNSPTKGHLEIYLNTNSEVQVAWNKPYAFGGFSQVNAQMNEKLQQIVKMQIKPEDKILDLFAGAGNLSRKLCENQDIWGVDIYQDSPPYSNFYNYNLYQEDSLPGMQQKINKPIDLLIVDPPRSGFNLLNNWCETFQPAKIILVSCNAATMQRDLQLLNGYQLTQIYLLDLFLQLITTKPLVFLKKSD